MSQLTEAESADPLVSFNWGRLLKYPRAEENIKPGSGPVIVFVDKMGSSKRTPMLAPLHVVNSMLQNAWLQYKDKFAKNNRDARDYSVSGESWMLDPTKGRTAADLYADRDLRYLAYLSARGILDSWGLPTVLQAGNTLAIGGASGPPTLVQQGTNIAVVNYWSTATQLDEVGLILTRSRDGAYMFKPYSGTKRPEPSELMYEDVSGVLRTGGYFRIGKIQWEKSDRRDVPQDNCLLACGLPSSLSNAAPPSLEMVDSRLQVHPTVLINPATKYELYN